jgi:hypothetical protein
MTIVPLVQLRVAGFFANALEETVGAETWIEPSSEWATAALRESQAAWYGHGQRVYAVSGTDLRFEDASGTAVSAQLREVVYVLNSSSSGVAAAVMVFQAEDLAGSRWRWIGVGVSGATFAEKFAFAASASGVMVSTVAWDNSKVPSASLVSPSFPNLKIEYEDTAPAPPNSLLKPEVPRIAVFAGATAGSIYATPLLMGTEIVETGVAYFGVPVTEGTIEPLELMQARLFVGMEQTVDRIKPFGIHAGKVSWRGLEDREYFVTNGVLTMAGLTVSALLREVVYVLNWSSGDVAAVVMVFHSGARRIGVVVSGATFAAKFSSTASTKDVLVSTVALDASLVPAASLKGRFPNVGVAWDETTSAPAISSVKPEVPRVAVVAGAQGSKLSGTLQPGAAYFGKTLPPVGTQAAQSGAATVAETGAQAAPGCEKYWAKWPSCAADGDAACETIARCARPMGPEAGTSMLVYAGTPVALRPVQVDSGLYLSLLGEGSAGALYGTKDNVIYVVKLQTAYTAKVIRKGSGEAELHNATLASGKWVVRPEADDPTPTVLPTAVPAECADLRACLKLTPLDLSKCAVQAAACKGLPPKLASGETLESGDRKVDLFAVGIADRIAEERALFGSDDRGVFVVSVTNPKDKKGKRLFVATDKAASVVDVEYDEGAATWREVRPQQGVDWALVGGVAGGIAFALMIALVVYFVRRKQAPPVVPLHYAPV